MLETKTAFIQIDRIFDATPNEKKINHSGPLDMYV